MTAADPRPSRTEPVERFRATSGRGVGLVSMAAIVALLAYLAVNVQTITGLRLGAGLAFLAAVVWVTQLRPRATAYPDGLHLQNSLRDGWVPWSAIDEVSVRRMLHVWAGDERYVCIGVGAPLRAMVKGRAKGPSSLLGWDRLESYTESSTPLLPDQSEMGYAEYVELRVNDLVAEAKRGSAGRRDRPGARPRRSWAWPEIAILAGTAAVFVVTLVL